MKLLRRRQFLHLAGSLAAVAGTSQSSWAESPRGEPSPQEILRRDLQGQGQKVEETLMTVITFAPGAVSTRHVHPGAQELVFGLEGKLMFEIDGEVATPMNAGDSALIPADLAHTVRNETADAAKILVVYSRSDKSKPLRVDVQRS
jgi:quercetin dioxygenase-like cupin family protein